MKKGLLVVVGVFSLFALVAQSTFAAWDKPCDKKKVLEAHWCDVCKAVREFTECSEIGYIWDFAKHKASGDKSHTDLPECWACQKIMYSCINTNCKKFGACLPAPGACDECGDDITSKVALSRVMFKCPKCGKESGEAGKGSALIKGSYGKQLEKAGDCETCGVPLEVICTKSGTCPHVTR